GSRLLCGHLVQHLSDIFDPLGGVAERSDDADLRGLVAVHDFLKSLDALPRLGEFVCQGNRHHNHQPVSLRLSISWARFIKYPSCPSSQAIRNCRLLIVTLTWDIPRGNLVCAHSVSANPAESAASGKRGLTNLFPEIQ